MSVARVAAVAALLAMLTSGCIRLGEQAHAWPPSAPEVEVTMTDYDIEIDDPPVPAGRVVFRVDNAGEDTHRLSVVPLPEDLPPIDEQLHGDERREVTPVAGTIPRSADTGSVLAVDLEPGRRYALLCYEQLDDGTVHALLGENMEFRAGGPDADPPTQDP